MSAFRATNSETAEVVEYDADQPQAEHRDPPWTLEQVFVATPTPDETPDTRMFGGRRKLTKLEFVALLGQQAYGAILMVAKTEVAVEMWVRMIDLATPDLESGYSIDLDDPRTQYGVQALGAMLAQAQVVPADWAATVLAG